MQQGTPGQGQSGDGLIGRTIAGYKITRYIARGGMGVVYEGVQVSLDRPVAIKILYPHLADDPSFVDRFQREARSEGKLNHPNIVRVLDFGSDAQTHYMIMDYIDGESLRDRLTRVSAEGLTLNTNVMMKIVEEVGSALTFAHGLGLVHRDVKPGNVLLGKDGHTYLADFGVVKILGDSLTVAGTIVGTPEYMAPEQSTGSSEVGPAADLYSLAVITYEMMVGRAPFKAPTPAAVLHMQLSQPPPPPSTLVPWFAPEVEEVIMQALAKDPAERYPSVAAYVEALKIATASIRERATSRYAAAGAAATMTAAAAVAGSGVAPAATGASAAAATATPPPSVGGTVPAQGDAASMAAAGSVAGAGAVAAGSGAGVAPASAAVPPVADTPAAGGVGAGPPSVAEGTGPVPESHGASHRRIVVFVLLALVIVAFAAYILTRGGDDNSTGNGGTPTSSALGIAATTTAGAENEPTATTAAQATPSSAASPVVPVVDATATEQSAEPTPTVAEQPGATPTGDTVAPTLTAEAAPTPTEPVPGAAPEGYKSVIVFSSHRGEVHDSEIYIMNPDGSDEHQLTFSRGHSWGPRVSHDGTRMFFSSVAPGEHTSHDATGGGTTGQGNHDIYLANVDGSNITKLTFVPSWDNGWSWSPDDSQITFTSDRDGNWEIYSMNPDGTNIVRLTNNPAEDGWPSWAPDGKSILFASDRDGNWEIYSMNPDGTGVRRLTNRPDTVDTYPYVSPDGTRVVFSSQVAVANEGEIYVMDIDGGNVTRLTSTIALNYAPSWAPDGSKIVFASDRDGNHNIYIMNPDGTEQQRLTDDPGEDTTPCWAWIKVGP